jgi:hypothetical protein
LKKKSEGTDTLITELLMDAGLFHAEADIKWLTLCASKIKEGSGKKREKGDTP